MKTIVITGGAGFIGKHLALRFAQDKENQILVLDNMISSKWTGLSWFDEHPNIHFFYKDITEPQLEMWLSVRCNELKIPEPSEIWNLACIASPKLYRAMPIPTIGVSVLGTQNVCNAARRFSAKLYHTSTSEVYGQTTENMKESNYGYVNPYGPRSCYDEGKRIAETIIYENAVSGLNVHVFRLFNTFGEGMTYDDGRVIPNFIVSALHRLPLQIYGSPNIRRSFCYVTETISKMIALAHTDYHKPINVGSDKNYYTLQELAELVKTVCLSDSEIIIKDPVGDDPQDRRPDLTLARSLVKRFDSFETDFIIGLSNTVSYFIDNVFKGKFEKDTLLIRHDFSSYDTPII